MKNKLIKNFALIMSFITMLGTLSVNAYELDSQGMSIESVEYQNSSEEEFTNETSVFAEIGSEYTVTIPKVIVLSGESKSAKYQVTANGDIAGYETVLVKPDDFVRLYSINKSEQMANISQTKTAWKVSELGTFGEGTINADGITAGRWSGSFNFNIGLDSFETIELENGKVELTKIEEEDLIQELVNDGYIQSAEQIDYFYEAKAVGDVEFPVTLTFNVDGEEGDQIAVYHHNGSEWEYITLATLTNGQITATFNSLSPIIFVNRSNLTLAPGLYDKNNNLIKSWNELELLGISIEDNFGSYFAYNHRRNWDSNQLRNTYMILETIPEYVSGDDFKIILPEDIKKIGTWAFARCKKITEIILPESLEYIAPAAFEESGLVKIAIPKNISSISDYVFNGCESLHEITLDGSELTEIGYQAFAYTAFTELTIPTSVTIIKGYAFANCKELSILVPQKAKIESYAFNRVKQVTYY